MEEKTVFQFDKLPEELKIYILKFLPFGTLLTLSNVCSRWEKLVEAVVPWRKTLLLFSYTHNIDDVRLVERHLSHMRCLQCLKMKHVRDYNEISSVIQRCPNLISLELVCCGFNKEFEADILKCPFMEKIDFHLGNSISFELAIEYDRFKDLKYLAMSDCSLPDISCKSLLNCKNLAYIDIGQIKNIDIEYINNLILSKLEILEGLKIRGDDAVNDESLYLLSHCKSLKVLHISRCNNLTDVGLIYLKNLQMLEQLEFCNNLKFTENGLHSTLGSLTNLKVLSLVWIVNFTPRTVNLISEKYKDLHVLSVHSCRNINQLHLCRSNLKDKFTNIILLYSKVNYHCIYRRIQSHKQPVGIGFENFGIFADTHVGQYRSMS